MPDSARTESPVESATENRSRSTPLKPVIWMTGVLVWATLIAFIFRVPRWEALFLCLLTGLSFLLYLGSYLFLMATDREALRAEHSSMKHLSSGQRRLRVNLPRDLLEGDQNFLAGLRVPHEKEGEEKLKLL